MIFKQKQRADGQLRRVLIRFPEVYMVMITEKRTTPKDKKRAGIASYQGGNSAHEHEMEESRTDYSFQEGRYENDTGFPYGCRK